MAETYKERRAELVNIVFIFAVLTIMTVVLFFGSRTMTGAVTLGFTETTSDNLQLNFTQAGSKTVNLSLYNKTYTNANLTLEGSLLELRFQQTDQFDFSEDMTHNYTSYLTTCNTEICGTDQACKITTNGYIEIDLNVYPTTDEILLSIKEGNNSHDSYFNIYIDGNYKGNYPMDSTACQYKNITISNIQAQTADGKITLKLASPGPTGDFSFAQLLIYTNNSYTTSPALYIGNNQAWNYSGLFNTTETTNNFSSILNPYLSTCTSPPCTVPLNITSQSSGTIILSGLNLEYTEYPPVLTAPIPNQTIPIGFNITDTLNLYDHFTDNNHDPLIFNVAGNVNISITIINGSVSFYPQYNWSGTETIIFSANDSINTTYSNNITVNVTENTPPQASQIQCHNGSGWTSCENIGYGESLKFRVNCTDPNGAGDLKKAGFLLYNQEDGSYKLDTETTTKSGDWWSYTYGQLQDSGSFNLTAACYDNMLSAGKNSTLFNIPWGNLSITIIEPSNNSYIHRTSFFNITAEIQCQDMECGYLEANLTINDSQLAAAQTTPFYTIDDNPQDYSGNPCLSSTIAGDSCNITWSVNATGNNATMGEFKAKVKSGSYSAVNAAESNSINITITNTAPYLTANLTGKSWNQDTSATIALTGHFNDSDRDELSFIAHGNSHITISFSSGIAALTPASGWHGKETIYFTATDGEFNISSNNITLTVNEVAATTTSSGGGGGGSGRQQPQKISSFASIIPHKDYTLGIDGDKLIVSRIFFRTNKELKDVSFRVVIPEYLKVPFADNAYEYFMIEKENIEDEDLEDLRLEFMVENGWIEQYDGIMLQRYEDSGWNNIDTRLNVKKDSYSYYVAYLDSFSTFVITGYDLLKPEVLNISKDTIKLLPEVKKMVIEQIPLPDNILPVDIVILGVVVLLLLFAAILLFRLSRRPSRADILNKRQREKEKLILQKEKLKAKLEAERRKDYEKRAKKAAKRRARLLKEKKKTLARQRRKEAILKFLHALGLYRTKAEKREIEKQREARRQRIESERKRIIEEKEKAEREIQKEKENEWKRIRKEKEEEQKRKENEERARKAAKTRLENEKIKAKEESIRQKELEKRREQLEKQRIKEAKIRAEEEFKKRKENEERAGKAAETRRTRQLEKEKQEYENQRQLEEEKLRKEKEKALKEESRRKQSEDKDTSKEREKLKKEELKRKEEEIKRRKELEARKEELRLKKEKIAREKRLKRIKYMKDTRKRFFNALHSVGLYRTPAEKRAIKKRKEQEKKEKIKMEKAKKRKPLKSIEETHKFIKKEHEKTKIQNKIIEKAKEIREKKKKGFLSSILKKKKPEPADLLKPLEEKQPKKEKKIPKLKEHIRLPEIPPEIGEIKERPLKAEVKEEPRPKPIVKPKVSIDQLVNIAEKAIHAGHSRDEIRSMMGSKGWDSNTIDLVFSKVKISKDQMLSQHLADIESKLRNL